MTIVDRLRYDGKRALVVGGATGMGGTNAPLGVVVPEPATVMLPLLALAATLPRRRIRRR